MLDSMSWPTDVIDTPETVSEGPEIKGIDISFVQDKPLQREMEYVGVTLQRSERDVTQEDDLSAGRYT